MSVIDRLTDDHVREVAAAIGRVLVNGCLPVKDINTLMRFHKLVFDEERKPPCKRSNCRTRPA